MLCSCHAIAACINGARRLKGGEVQELAGRMCSRKRISNQVGASKAFAASIEIAEEIHIERLSCAQGGHSVDTPPGGQPRQGLGAGQLIGKHPDKVLAYVEVGVGLLGSRVKAIVRLRCIGNEVLSVARIVD